MHRLEFTAAHLYGNEREGISVPVLPTSGAHSVHLAASIDTGAAFCLFRNELAETLGLDITSAPVKALPYRSR